MSYDKFYKQDLWLWLPFTEGTGTLTHDHSIWRVTPFTLHGVGWVWAGINSVQVLDFNAGVPSWLDCPALTSAKLDFTSGDFSMAVWAVKSDPATRTLLCRGLANTDGWFMQVSNAQRLSFATCQAGLTQATYSAICALFEWNLWGVSRRGGDVKTFVNGQDITDVPDIHTDPTTANRELHVGILDDEAGAPWHGSMWNPRIWGRYLEPWEWLELWNMERHCFGV
jgi:hypothetical protein